MSTNFAEAANAVEEVAVGAATAARKVAARRVRPAQRQVRKIERRGALVARRINHRVTARIRALTPDRVGVWGIELNGQFPEKAGVKGLHLVKARARRHDRMGEVAKRTLMVLNASFKAIAGMATRFEQASELTAVHPAAVKSAVRKRAPRRRKVRHAA